MPHPELEQEQSQIDLFYETAEAELAHGDERSQAEAAADKHSARIARQEDSERLKTLKIAIQRNICMGRMETQTATDPIYVGRIPLFDEQGRLVLVSALAASAKPFFTARAKSPQGIVRRRRFRMDGRRLVDISEETWGKAPEAEAAPEPAEPELDDSLLDELLSSRGAEMRDIVATIQADQYEIASAPLEETLLVQGGPGTGKTAIGLHRAAYLLFNNREELSRGGVLVVGPNQTFMSYVRDVLPSLGETGVDQISVDLLTSLRPRRQDPPAVERLKGDGRMARVLAAELRRRISPIAEPIVFTLERQRFAIDSEPINQQIERLSSRGAYMPARAAFREQLLSLAVEAVTTEDPISTAADADAARDRLRSNTDLQNALERIWPTMTGPRLVHELLTGPRRLALAAEGILEAREQEVLRRPEQPLGKAPWTRADVPLVHEADHLVNGAVERYGLVIVDEAQDLTPMQVRMLGRRAAHSLTLLGDLAQAMGSHRWQSWQELIEQLPGERTATTLDLRVSYRVPKEVLDFARPLLDKHPAEVATPTAIRETGSKPTVVAVDALDQLATRALGEASSQLAIDGTVGLIAAPEHHERLKQAAEELGLELFEVARDGLGDSISLLEPALAKGLEFDHVVVVEPAALATEGAGDVAALYVALTRPTKSLTVVHHRPLPAALGGPRPDSAPKAGGAPAQSAAPLSLAEAVAICQLALTESGDGTRLLAEGLTSAATELAGGSPERAGEVLVNHVLSRLETPLADALREQLPEPGVKPAHMN